MRVSIRLSAATSPGPEKVTAPVVPDRLALIGQHDPLIGPHLLEASSAQAHAGALGEGCQRQRPRGAAERVRGRLGREHQVAARLEGLDAHQVARERTQRERGLEAGDARSRDQDADGRWAFVGHAP